MVTDSNFNIVNIEDINFEYKSYKDNKKILQPFATINSREIVFLNIRKKTLIKLKKALDKHFSNEKYIN